MKRMIVLSGCPGSGKSTWIREHLHTFEGYSAVISRDNIRFLLVSEDEEYFSKEKEVFKKFIDDIKFSLENADTIVVDATHINEASRGKLLRHLGESLKGVTVDALVVRTPLEIALAQNEKRIGTRSYVPPTAIRRMYSQFTMPSFDEGFDTIYVYQPHKVGTKYTVFKKEDK